MCKIEKPVIGGGTGDSASVPPAAVSKDSASQPSGPSNQVELISGVYAIAYMLWLSYLVSFLTRC